MNRIILINNYNSLLLILLKNKIDNKDCFIFYKEDFDEKIRYNLNLLYKVIILKKDKNYILRILKYFYMKKKLKKHLINKKILITIDHNLIGNYIAKKFNNIELYEEGLAIYSKINWKNKNVKKLFGLNINKCFGKNKNIKKVYLTGIGRIPKEIEYKSEVVDLKKLWRNKTTKEQDEILSIFSFNLDIIDKLKNKNIILFTQPLSEDGVISEKEKIDIYSNIIKKYPKNELIIKIHPREKTNYKKIFKDYFVLDNILPFEILNLLDIKFKKAVTLFSTAALSFNEDTKIDFYGTEVNSKILERFGSCNHIMVRNCFLEVKNE